MITRELVEEFKKACAETECEKCEFSVGIYMEGLDYTYYSCDLRKKPRDYDVEKVRIKQTKQNRSGKPEKEKKKRKKKTESTTEPTEKKKRGRKKKVTE